MHHTTPHLTTRTTYRAHRPSLSPYILDDVALTLSEVRQARAEGEVPAGRSWPMGGSGDVRPYLRSHPRDTLNVTQRP